MTIDKILIERKARIDKQLSDRGILGYEIKHPSYMDFDESTFATAYRVGIRMIVLYLSAFVAYNLNEAEKIADWLRREKLWKYASPKEQALFMGKVTGDIELGDFSWRIESSYTLAWALNLIEELHPPVSEISEEQMAEFLNKMPKLGAEIGSYLNNLSLRDKEEIYEENVLNELATTYFRDLLFNGKKDTTDIDRHVSYERHTVLNWVSRFSDTENWDDTDTST